MSNETSIERAPSSTILLMPVAAPQQLMEAHKATIEFIKSALVEGTDYGVIPGTGDKGKPTLLKAGAERLTAGYGLRPEYEIVESESDHDRECRYSLSKWTRARDPGQALKAELKAQGVGRNKSYGGVWQWQEREAEEGVSLGLYRYVMRCRLYLRDREVGQGVGSCSSLETKYIRAPRDSENTIVKMAKKRAYVDAVLTTLGLSDRFTQDVEDIHANVVATGEITEAEYTESKEEVEVLTKEQVKLMAGKAAAYFKTLAGSNQEEYKKFAAYCESENSNWIQAVNQAAHDGVKSITELWIYVKEGRKPAEVVELDPKDESDIPAVMITNQTASVSPASSPMKNSDQNSNDGAIDFGLTTRESAMFKALCKGKRVDPDTTMLAAWKIGARDYKALMKHVETPPAPVEAGPDEFDPFAD